DPPYPPRVGVLARCAGRARLRTRTVRGSRQLPPRPTTYHLPPITYHSRLPRFARVRGRPPIPPESRRTCSRIWSRESKHRNGARVASAAAATYHLPPTTYHLRLPPSAFRLPSSACPVACA